MTTRLQPVPLTPEAFAPYGDVIALPDSLDATMNAGRFERTVGLAAVDMHPPQPARIDIARCVETTELPCRITVLERHPLGSQAFVPLSPFRFVIAVAPPGDGVPPEAVRAFVTDGRQGVNYHRGTWHVPLIARAGQSFLVIERDGDEGNCDEHRLAAPLTLEAPA